MRISCVVIAALMLCACNLSRAAIVRFDFTFEYTEAVAPAGPKPWLSASFDDGGSPGSVTLTIQSHLIAQEFAFNTFFNLDPALNPISLVFSSPLKTGTFQDPKISKGLNAFHAGGEGLYDILLEFSHAPPTSRFGPGESVQYLISGIPSLTANSFNFLSHPSGSGGLYPVASKIGGIGTHANLSGWITHVPEPATVSLLSMALLAAGLRLGRAKH